MSSPFQHAETPYDLSDIWEHNDMNSEDDGYWTFMGPPFYDSSRPGSVVSIQCSKEEQLDEVTHVEIEFNIVWVEELAVTLSKDDEDMIYKFLVE